MPRVSHEDLITLANILGYSIKERGLCRGYSMMWVQAIMAGEKEKFSDRIHLINRLSQHSMYDLKAEIESIRQKVINKEELSNLELDILEIPAFFEGIMLYLNSVKDKRPILKKMYKSPIDLFSEIEDPTLLQFKKALNESDRDGVVLYDQDLYYIDHDKKEVMFIEKSEENSQDFNTLLHGFPYKSRITHDSEVQLIESLTGINKQINLNEWIGVDDYHQDDFDLIAPIATSKKIDNTNIGAQLYATDPGVFSKQKLEQYLKKIKKNVKKGTPILLSSGDHSIGIMWDGKKWEFNDSNSLGKTGNEFKKVESTRELSQVIFSAFGNKYSKHCLVKYYMFSDLNEKQKKKLAVPITQKMLENLPSSGMDLVAYSINKVDKKLLSLIMAKSPDLVKERHCMNGFNWIHKAVLLDDHLLVDDLLENLGTDILEDIVKESVGVSNKLNGQTPLQIACNYGDIEMIKLLLDNKSEPNIAIETLIRTRRFNVVSQLVNDGYFEKADVSIELLLDNNFEQLIQFLRDNTLEGDDVELDEFDIKKLLKNKNWKVLSDLKAHDVNFEIGFNKLHLAILAEDLERVETVLAEDFSVIDKTGDMKKSKYSNKSPVALACGVGNKYIIERLVGYGACKFEVAVNLLDLDKIGCFDKLLKLDVLDAGFMNKLTDTLIDGDFCFELTKLIKCDLLDNKVESKIISYLTASLDDESIIDIAKSLLHDSRFESFLNLIQQQIFMSKEQQKKCANIISYHLVTGKCDKEVGFNLCSGLLDVGQLSFTEEIISSLKSMPEYASGDCCYDKFFVDKLKETYCASSDEIQKYQTSSQKKLNTSPCKIKNVYSTTYMKQRLKNIYEEIDTCHQSIHDTTSTTCR